ncbi:hypothetical protein [Fictibacillus sp. 26RED30]|uniref:hypothetical protein n=1 Tax=Fictibacillus sp. 26RED30 TaxID=2745877 RepID=UPI0018CFE845|nr:hypothetical protein [Fictibacillus sp. 26RED30]MBH0160460.1 hypothetical protein [Fictibacillus sp. 26RED30]
MKQKIEDFFYLYDFKKIGTFESDSYVNKLLIKTEFQDIFINQDESEAYIVIFNDHIFKEEELKMFESKIIGLIGYLPNTPIRYNINLVLACPLKIKEGDRLSETSNAIIRYERIKYYCRRFFLDIENSSFEDELIMLPFSSIQLDIDVKGYNGILREIQKIVPENLYEELMKDQTDFSRIKNLASIQQ